MSCSTSNPNFETVLDWNPSCDYVQSMDWIEQEMTSDFSTTTRGSLMPTQALVNISNTTGISMSSTSSSHGSNGSTKLDSPSNLFHSASNYSSSSSPIVEPVFSSESTIDYLSEGILMNKSIGSADLDSIQQTSHMDQSSLRLHPNDWNQSFTEWTNHRNSTDTWNYSDPPNCFRDSNCNLDHPDLYTTNHLVSDSQWSETIKHDVALFECPPNEARIHYEPCTENPTHDPSMVASPVFRPYEMSYSYGDTISIYQNNGQTFHTKWLYPLVPNVTMTTVTTDCHPDHAQSDTCITSLCLTSGKSNSDPTKPSTMIPALTNHWQTGYESLDPIPIHSSGHDLQPAEPPVISVSSSSSSSSSSNRPNETRTTKSSDRQRHTSSLKNDNLLTHMVVKMPSKSTSSDTSTSHSGSIVAAASAALANLHHRGSLQLWQFLIALLDDVKSQHLICWTGRTLEFKLNEPEEVARLWGIQKNRPAMNYDKLSRSLRYYYEKGIMQKVSGERYVYRFVYEPELLFALAFPGEEQTLQDVLSCTTKLDPKNHSEQRPSDSTDRTSTKLSTQITQHDHQRNSSLSTNSQPVLSMETRSDHPPLSHINLNPHLTNGDDKSLSSGHEYSPPISNKYTYTYFNHTPTASHDNSVHTTDRDAQAHSPLTVTWFSTVNNHPNDEVNPKLFQQYSWSDEWIETDIQESQLGNGFPSLDLLKVHDSEVVAFTDLSPTNHDPDHYHQLMVNNFMDKEHDYFNHNHSSERSSALLTPPPINSNCGDELQTYTHVNYTESVNSNHQWNMA